MTWRKTLVVTGAFLLAIGFAGFAGAEDPGRSEISFEGDSWVEGVDTIDPDAHLKWGIGDPIPIALPCSAFNGANAGHDDAIQRSFNGSQIYCTSALCVLMAPIYPIHGSYAASLEFRGYDADDAGRIMCSLFECADGSESCTEGPYFGTTDPFNSGYFSSSTTLSPTLTFDTVHNAYTVYCFIDGGSQDTRLANFRIFTYLQVSPAPAVATFADVPVGAFGFQHVEALAASGITAGCGGGNFCPNQPLTRVQMAVFLAKALGLHWAD